ncbi:PIG-L family deacetylase [Paenarthrobacter sp. NPDC089675]|uniref:PIG-L family deacetylase n=1 Tax=Paenarthrobacter sp. NPDC089675 TaxID=3364376 RepID=UPI003819F95F
MVTFSHTDAGTPEAAWSSSGVRVLPELPLGDDELSAMTFVVLAAHPDDESLGAGGLLAKLHAAGASIRLLLCTAGEASHPDSTTTTAEQLSAVRLAEFGAAVSGLAPGASWQFLELPDGKLAAASERIAGSVRSAIDESGAPAKQVVIVSPYRADGHIDHDTLGSVAAKLAEEGGHGLLEYPIWYWLWAGPDDATWTSWTRVPLTSAEQQAKARAMQSHTSQIKPLSGLPGDETLLSPTFLEHFARSWETFAWHPPVAGTNPAGSQSATSPTEASHRAGDAEEIFDAVHDREDDPWNYTTSWYERRKRALTLAALPEEHYDSGLEIGCSIGTLSVELAPRCANFLAVDASSKALVQAAERLRGYPGARTQKLTVPQEWPEGSFDLVVVSEVGYYVAPEELTELLQQVKSSMRPGGTLLLCHWRHPISGWQLDGETVHAMAREQLDWPSRALYREKDFLLEVLASPDGSS